MFPNLPTDNLYKFLALGGVVMFGLGVWLLWSCSTELRKDEEVARRRMESILTSYEQLFQQVTKGKDLEQIKSLMLATPDEDRITAEGEVVSDKALLRVLEALKKKRLAEELANDSNELSILNPKGGRTSYRSFLREISKGLMVLSLGDTDGKLKDDFKLAKNDLLQHELFVAEVWIKQDNARYVNIAGYSFILAGGILSIVGFVVWLLRVQLHQDKLTGLQLEKARQDLQSDN